MDGTGWSPSRRRSLHDGYFRSANSASLQYPDGGCMALRRAVQHGSQCFHDEEWERGGGRREPPGYPSLFSGARVGFLAARDVKASGALEGLLARNHHSGRLEWVFRGGLLLRARTAKAS